jgi:hypothetical protein
MQHGALVVHIREYTQPLEKTIHRALGASADQIPIPLPEGSSLPDLIRTVCDAIGGTLVLILDQFEGLYGPAIDDEQRAATLESLAEALRAVDPELLRLVIALREDALDHWGELKEHLPELWNTPIPLFPLDRKQAQLAIEAPLAELGFPNGVSYVGDLVPSRLVPELAALTPEEPNWITPSHLQIVCYWLYETASTRRPPHINQELYRELKGAAGIMASYVGDTLKTQLSTQRPLAQYLMEAMAYPDLGPWVPPDELPLNGSTPEEVRDVLDRLVEAQLVVSRGVNGRQEYAFANPVVAQGVRDQAPPAVKRRYQAYEDLERAWSAWLAHESLASRVQLGHLEEARSHLSPSAVKVLLLLRSAVARNTPDNAWPTELRAADQGTELIRQLEEPYATDLAWHSAPSTLDQAQHLLGLDDGGLPDRPGDTGRAFGPVAWSAASHPEPTTRQTAALALTALEPYPEEALDRLRWALGAGANGRHRWLRKIELRGTLADADPDNELLDSDLSSIDRIGRWLWRARRRMIRDRHSIFWPAMGGGIGAALALGLLRAAIGALTGRPVGIQFALNFWWAWILGAALSLGLTLAEPLLLSRSEKGEETPPIWRAPLHPDRRPALLAVCLGTIFFGLANLLVAWFNGVTLSKAPLVAPMGFVAGLGLSIALYGQPRAGRRLGVLGWLSRLGVAALTFGLTQAIFIIAVGQRAYTLPIVRSGNYYYAQLFDAAQKRWPDMVLECCTGWPTHLALIDAALVGIALAIGITAGLLVAVSWLNRWLGLIDQSDG